MVTKFERTANIADALRNGCPCSVRSTDNTETVALTFAENLQQSAVRVSNQLGIPRSSLHRMMIFFFNCANREPDFWPTLHIPFNF